MRPHPITVALALIGIGINVAIIFKQALNVDLPPFAQGIGFAIGMSCILVAVVLFVYGFRPSRVEGALSRKARRQLTRLRREIRWIVRAFKRWGDLGAPPDGQALERLAAFETTCDRLDQWVRSVRRWCQEHRPQAGVTFWNAPEFRAELKLAEYYGEQIDQVRSEVGSERAGLKGRLGLVLNKLGELHHRGLRLANSLSFGYFAVGDTLKLDLLEDVQEWSNEVELYLRNHRDLGLSYSSRFVNNAPFPQGAVSLSAEIIIAWRKDWETAVRRRCDNLSALIAELQQRRGAI